MKEKKKVPELGCNDILSEMEKLQVLGGNGGKGGDNIACLHHLCEYNNGCSNASCATDSGCLNEGCVYYNNCGGHEPINPNGNCM